MYIHNICYDSNIFQEFWVNLLFFCKKNLFYQLFFYGLTKYLDFCVLFFTFVSTYVFNTESLNQEFFRKFGLIYLFFCVKNVSLIYIHTDTGELCCLAGQLLLTSSLKPMHDLLQILCEFFLVDHYQVC